MLAWLLTPKREEWTLGDLWRQIAPLSQLISQSDFRNEWTVWLQVFISLKKVRRKEKSRICSLLCLCRSWSVFAFGCREVQVKIGLWIIKEGCRISPGLHLGQLCHCRVADLDRLGESLKSSRAGVCCVVWLSSPCVIPFPGFETQSFPSDQREWGHGDHTSLSVSAWLRVSWTHCTPVQLLSGS